MAASQIRMPIVTRQHPADCIPVVSLHKNAWYIRRHCIQGNHDPCAGRIPQAEERRARHHQPVCHLAASRFDGKLPQVFVVARSHALFSEAASHPGPSIWQQALPSADAEPSPIETGLPSAQLIKQVVTRKEAGAQPCHAPRNGKLQHQPACRVDEDQFHQHTVRPRHTAGLPRLCRQTDCAKVAK